MENVLSFDRELFHFVNSEISNAAFDWIFPAITDLHKSPFFIFLLLIVIGFSLLRSWRRTTVILLTLTLVIAVSDNVSYRVIKPVVGRSRPADVEKNLLVRGQKHNGDSFPSNHSANMFSASAVLSGVFPQLSPLWYFLAALIAFSRIYVGAHYPLDVVAGALLGLLVGVIGRKYVLDSKWSKQFQKKETK